MKIPPSHMCDNVRSDTVSPAVNPHLRRLHAYSDYLLINSYAVDRIGLYEGKSGMCLALFELYSLLDDDRLEARAGRLLEECLLTPTDDISFSSGRAGVAYVTRHLLKRGLIDIDYNEQFGELEESILGDIKKYQATDKQEDLFAVLEYAPLFADRHNREVYDICNNVICRLFHIYSGKWQDVCSDDCVVLDEEELIRNFELLVKYAVILAYTPSKTLLESYAKACREVRLIETPEQHVFIGMMLHRRSKHDAAYFTATYPPLTDVPTVLLRSMYGTNTDSPSLQNFLLEADDNDIESFLPILIAQASPYSFAYGVARIAIYLCLCLQEKSVARQLETLLIL